MYNETYFTIKLFGETNVEINFYKSSYTCFKLGMAFFLGWRKYECFFLTSVHK